MVLVNSGFHTRSNFSENCLQFGHAPSREFLSPVEGRESCKNICFKGRQIISLPGVLTSQGRPWLRNIQWKPSGLHTELDGVLWRGRLRWTVAIVSSSQHVSLFFAVTNVNCLWFCGAVGVERKPSASK